ncbi:MAG: helix-turn-helix domain-containing protein [Alphaproteobacteria bacterium]
MERRDTVRIFRARLGEAIDHSTFNRSGLARAVGIDRSTLSQLLSSENDRLPRADTVAAIAAALQVSLDWLLGLSQEEKLGADILQQSLQIEPSSADPADERLARWHAEAAGYKIRHVPSTLPDVLKSDAVIRYEYDAFQGVTPLQAKAKSQARLAYMRLPETDMEVCSPLQTIEGFARGEGIWRGLSDTDRSAQLRQMIDLVEELYPSLRWFLFDGLTRYSVPITVFGPRRAAVYVGQMYFVFNTTEHIRVLARHFDGLIRAAVVQPPEVGGFLCDLLGELEAGARLRAGAAT